MLTFRLRIVMGLVLVGFGVLAITGGNVLRLASAAQAPRASGAAAPSNQISEPDDSAIAVERPDVVGLVQELRDLARKHFDDQRHLYEMGRSTVDEYIKACREIERIELGIATSQNARNVIRRQHLTRLKELETQRKGEVEHGTVTEFELNEIRLLRMEAELDVKSPKPDEQGLAAIVARLSELERKVQQIEKRTAGLAGGR